MAQFFDFKKILRTDLDWIRFFWQKCGFIFEAFVMFSPLDCFISPLWVWQRWHELCSAAFIWLKQAPNYLWSRKTSQRKSFWEREWDRAKDVACASQLFASCRLAPWTWTAYLLPACFWGFCLSPASPSLNLCSSSVKKEIVQLPGRRLKFLVLRLLSLLDIRDMALKKRYDLLLRNVGFSMAWRLHGFKTSLILRVFRIENLKISAPPWQKNRSCIQKFENWKILKK